MPFLVEALLLGGAPVHLDLNSTAASLAVTLGELEQCAPASKRILGFVGWRLPSGRVVRGVAAFDRLMHESADFAALPSPVRAHIIEEEQVLAASAVEESVPCPMERDGEADASCKATIRGPDDATKVHYDPTHDDEGCFVTMQSRNNCYNYGTDVLTNTFAQPGRGSGVCSHHTRPCIPNNCADVARAAVNDSLVWVGTELPTTLPKRGHYVSLHIWPDSNFHWLRMDANFTWSHKPGGSPVRNVDNNGDTIVDPAKCDVSPWSTHCGYLLAVPSEVTLY